MKKEQRVCALGKERKHGHDDMVTCWPFFFYLLRLNSLQGSVDLVVGNILDQLGDLALIIDEEETLLDVLDLLDGAGVD